MRVDGVAGVLPEVVLVGDLEAHGGEERQGVRAGMGGGTTGGRAAIGALACPSHWNVCVPTIVCSGSS